MIKEILIVTYLLQFSNTSARRTGFDDFDLGNKKGDLDFEKFKISCTDGELLAGSKICFTKKYKGLMQDPPTLFKNRIRLNFIEMEDVQIINIGRYLLEYFAIFLFRVLAYLKVPHMIHRLEFEAIKLKKKCFQILGHVLGPWGTFL